MKSVKTSEFKAKLAKYLRMVRNGEEIQILDRGIPIAKVLNSGTVADFKTRPPLKDPRSLSQLKSKVSPIGGFDVVDFLLEERRKR
jgi:antitoxin (DNA-binding transcriptional repressor) of toxin-antitoxin stability system